MKLNLKYNSGMICDPVSFRDITNLNAQNIATVMLEKAE